MTSAAREITNNHPYHRPPRYFTTATGVPRDTQRMSSFGFLGGLQRPAGFTAAAVSDDASPQTKAISPVWSRGGERLGKL